MPSMFGGSSTDRDYAPHMYVLREGGDSADDAAYDFVGNATTYYDDDKTGIEYHVGVNILGELVGDAYPQGKPIEHKGIPTCDIPREAIDALIRHGVRQVSTLEGHRVLAACGIELPTDLEPISFEKIFNGTEQEKAAEQELSKRWKVIGEQIISTLE